MEDQIGLEHLLKRGAEGGHERRRQIGDEADSVGQDGLGAAGKAQRADGRVEGCEQDVLGEDLGAGQRVEQGRLAGIGVTDKRDRRVRYALTGLAMERAGALDLLELFADDVDPFAQEPSVGLDLRLAGATEKAEAAALPFKVGPRAHEAALLVDEMGELDLQAPFPGSRPLAEDLENEPGAVEHLDVPGGLEIALLHGRERVIDDHELCILGTDQAGKLFDLARAEQCRRFRLRHGHDPACPHVEIDGSGKAHRLLEAALRRALGRLEIPPPRVLSRLLVEDRHENDCLHTSLGTHVRRFGSRPLLLTL